MTWGREFYLQAIGVATYTVVAQLPEAYRNELPSPEAIAERLRLWDKEKGMGVN